MENTEQITIITTLRVDSSERQRNMDAVLRYLQPTGIRVLVLEADRENLYTTWKDFENVDFCFVYDEDPVFYRTHYLFIDSDSSEHESTWSTRLCLRQKNFRHRVGLFEYASTRNCCFFFSCSTPF